MLVVADDMLLYACNACAFMNPNPRMVAAFVSECLDYRCFEASDLLPYATRETLEELGLVAYQIDTFSSDYDDDHIAESGMVYDNNNNNKHLRCGNRKGLLGRNDQTHHRMDPNTMASRPPTKQY